LQLQGGVTEEAREDAVTLVIAGASQILRIWEHDRNHDGAGFQRERGRLAKVGLGHAVEAFLGEGFQVVMEEEVAVNSVQLHAVRQDTQGLQGEDTGIFLVGVTAQGGQVNLQEDTGDHIERLWEVHAEGLGIPVQVGTQLLLPPRVCEQCSDATVIDRGELVLDNGARVE